jgi:hypothetical protein
MVDLKKAHNYTTALGAEEKTPFSWPIRAAVRIPFL